MTVNSLKRHQGEVEQGIELYSLISRYDFVANSKWFEDIFGKQIAAMAVNLTPEIIQAAQERAQSLDVWQTAHALLEKQPK